VRFLRRVGRQPAQTLEHQQGKDEVQAI
jgi:hypothetical protein